MAEMTTPTPVTTPRRSRKRRQTGAPRGSNAWAHVVLSIGGFIMVFPFLWQVLMSLSSTAEVTSVPPTFWPSELRFDNYVEVFRQVPFLEQFWVSVRVTVATVVGQVVLCSMAGYAFARMRFAASAAIFAVMLSILMIPNQAYLIPQYQIVQSLGWLDTVPGIVIPTIFSAFGTFLMRQFFVNLPDELEEAARLDGANTFQIFWRVMLPLARPSISALAIITVLAAWNNLLWPLVVTSRAEHRTLSVGIASLNGQYVIDYPVMMAASLMAMAPILILFIVMQRRVIEGLAHSGLKG
ncbi:carbohydrate ABC transporter membrane protein [Brachybacterium faecium DSM 4810]|uniref:Carbohydrate ABC transporter membrane protein n=1 Tax=Brachybacterium faecium (strain ATCC 43885 / DSM 4810 / JCM 11609 / LMG 19847 / NBRC 14762 / NCIMB 9860 / 6-10) TaxID=446465 RepID=C7MHH1_BRAFD|nr:carbohydrate ABC transporter membrane protein [Brachybacterium faecium DSM 4810]